MSPASDGIKLVSVPMPERMADRIKALADSRERSTAAEVRLAVAAYLEVEEPREAPAA